MMDKLSITKLLEMRDMLLGRYYFMSPLDRSSQRGEQIRIRIFLIHRELLSRGYIIDKPQS